MVFFGLKIVFRILLRRFDSVIRRVIRHPVRRGLLSCIAWPILVYVPLFPQTISNCAVSRG
jgi:hypothetical protein